MRLAHAGHSRAEQECATLTAAMKTLLATLVLTSCLGCSTGSDRRPTLGLLGDADPRVLYTVATREPLVALTIDDGPDPDSTPAILDVLAKHEATATFFLISSRVPGNEALVDRIVAEGHEVANHHVRDEPSIGLAPREFARGLRAARSALSPWPAARWFRPGSGWYDEAMLDVLDVEGYVCALGSIYPLDAQIPSSRWASWLIRHRASAGDVVILHDGGARGRRTARALGSALPVLRERGLRAVSLSRLVAAGAPSAAGEAVAVRIALRSSRP
jgi:peptidoglycan/xylan/chitin deacetylase (PgdA/CDA1 family)